MLVPGNRDPIASVMWSLRSCKPVSPMLRGPRSSPWHEEDCWGRLVVNFIIGSVLKYGQNPCRAEHHRKNNRVGRVRRSRGSEMNWGHLWISRCDNIAILHELTLGCRSLSSMGPYFSLPHLLSHLVVFGMLTQSETTSQVVISDSFHGDLGVCLRYSYKTSKHLV